MNIKIREMLTKERPYAYTQSQQLMMQTGCIGHLRGDFDSNGKGFFTSWDDHHHSLKTEEFKTEFDQVVKALRDDKRFGGILKNREAMSKYCFSRLESSFAGDFFQEFGFCIDTARCAYRLRAMPQKGNYNFYIYAYQRNLLEQHMTNAEQGIRFVDTDYKEIFRISDGAKIRIQCSNGESYERVCRFIDPYHMEVGRELYHIMQFAEKMECAHAKVVPVAASTQAK